MSDLKNCPFCGSDKVAVGHTNLGYEALCFYYGAGCKSRTGIWPTRTEAIVAWNRRTPVTAEAGEVSEAIEREANFILDRLDDLVIGWDDDESYRQFSDHVVPSMGRLRHLLAARRALDNSKPTPAVGDDGLIERLRDPRTDGALYLRQEAASALAAAHSQHEADVARNADLEQERDEAYQEGYDEGKSEWDGVKAQLWNAIQHWLELRHGLLPDADGFTVEQLLDGLREVESENKSLRDRLRKVTTPNAALIAALKAQEHAENEQANCPDCDGTGDWAECGRCSELFGTAIELRRAALAGVKP